MIRYLTLILALVLLSPAARAAGDQYASLKPLLGTWIVDKTCGTYKDRVLVVIKRLPKTVVANFHDLKMTQNLGRADIFSAGEDGRYNIVAALPDNEVLKAMGLKSIAGTLVVSDDDSDPEGPGKDYLTMSSRVSVLSNLLTIKLRENYKKATFILKTESPLGGQTCKGSGSKLPAPKKGSGN